MTSKKKNIENNSCLGSVDKEKRNKKKEHCTTGDAVHLIAVSCIPDPIKVAFL